MKFISLFSCLLFLLFPLFGMAKVYYFVGNEDSFYENPANWQPYYPGTEIGEEDVVIIQSNVDFEGYDLEIKGKLMLEWGISLHSPSGGMEIGLGGELVNEGDISVKYIYNRGKIENGLAGIIFAEKYASSASEPTKNLVTATYQSIFETTQREDIWADASGGVSISLTRGEVHAPVEGILQSETQHSKLKPLPSSPQNERTELTPKWKIFLLKMKTAFLQASL